MTLFEILNFNRELLERLAGTGNQKLYGVKLINITFLVLLMLIRWTVLVQTSLK